MLMILTWERAGALRENRGSSVGIMGRVMWQAEISEVVALVVSVKDHGLAFMSKYW
jgi:hypothetical protein